MNLFDTDLALPIFGAIAAGAVIGAEREYRASPAGFRTHILVSLSCSLLMLAAVHQVRWLSDTPHEIIRIDPVRMAHGILTGIGFLCGGVIFREGFSVRGLTTAASLWTTASLGMLFGVGFFSLAICGSVATVCVLAAVRVSERVLPQRRYATIKIGFRRSSIISLQKFRSQLTDAGLNVASISRRMENESIELSATVSGDSDDKMERLTTLFQQHSEVTGFDYLPHDT